MAVTHGGLIHHHGRLHVMVALPTSAGLGFVPGAIGTHSRAPGSEASRICFVVCVLIGAVRYAQ